MDKAVQKYHKKWIEKGPGDPEDKQYRKMFEDDVKDLKKGLDLMKKKDYKGAIKFLDNLDTAVRDEIPTSVWNFLNKHTSSPDDF